MRQITVPNKVKDHRPAGLYMALVIALGLVVLTLTLRVPAAAAQLAWVATATSSADALPVPSPESVGVGEAAQPMVQADESCPQGKGGWESGSITRPLILWPRVEVLATSPVPGWDFGSPGLTLPGKVDSGSQWNPAEANGPLTIAKSAPEKVYLGELLNYSLVITNNTTQNAVADIQDVLPIETPDDDVECQPECIRGVEVVTITVYVPTRYGAPYTVTVTTTYYVLWEGLTLAPGETVNLAFSIRIAGQQDGTILRNRAYVHYELEDGSVGTAMSEETATTVQVYVSPGIGASISDIPTWYSEDYGGTGSLDWGDFNRDGYLDLAVGGSSGTTVYRNEQGRLVKFWGNTLYSHNVNWIDLQGDGLLELVSIGYDWWAGDVTNRLYKLSSDGGRFVDAGVPSFKTHRLLQAEPADYDGDGDLDLIAVTAWDWAPDGCTFRAYPNDGGHLTNPYICLADPFQDYGQRTENLLSLSDYDNDDDPDLIMDVYDMDNPAPDCPYVDMLWIAPNHNGVFTATQPLTVDTFDRCIWPVDIAWGDYDRDGDLDMAAAIPALTLPDDHQVRIYRNQTQEGGSAFTTAFTFTLPFSIPYSFPPYAVEWGDVDSDGDLDLAVAGASSAFRVYINVEGSFASDRFISTPVVAGGDAGFALDLAAADYDNDRDLDMVVGNPLGPNALFTTFAPLLSVNLSSIDSWSASSVAWGDADRDGRLDLLFGASDSTVVARVYYNEEGTFPNYAPFPASGFGPHAVGFGDMNSDGALDIALGTAEEVQVYLQGNRAEPDWVSAPTLGISSLAWGDADDDGDLDLAVGTDGSCAFYVNQGGQLGASPAWTSGASGDTRSIAWGDYDNDRYLDLAVGNYGQPNRIYRNNGDHTFTLTWSAPDSLNTTSVAWGDYDGDGDPDLAVGNYGQPNLIYENVNGDFGPEPVWVSTEMSQTTSLAWGDWDSDGDLDLAVGNNGERNQVYLNRGSTAGAPRFLWLWSSDQAFPTTGLAWGDRDGDGDLDLAMSSENQIGVYVNNSILPSHLTEFFTPTMLLPNSPSYVSIERPGITDDAYFYSAADILSGPMQPTVTIRYRLFDPDGTRRNPGSDAPGEIISTTLFEFSPDNGGTWQPATPAADGAPPVTTTYRLGQGATFVWDAVADEAIGDNARFRITVIPSNRTGPVQRAGISAISPPFRIHATSCIWPQDATITVSNAHPDPGEEIRLEGAVAEASGVLTFTWDFDDGTTAVGQVVDHTYSNDNTYAVRLTVRSEPCPIAKEVFANYTIVVGSGVPDIYLPLVLKGS